MNNTGGALNFTASIYDGDFNRAITGMNRKIIGLSNTATSEARKIDSAFANMGRLAAGAFAAVGLAQLPGQIVRVRGEFQQLEISFNTMLQSKEKADKLMAEVATFAAQTPYGLKETAAATKQLLAYGESADTVIATMRRLGDIASGIGAPLSDIAYLYGTTMTQGRLYTQDLNQFTGRGIPMIRELAKIFGVAESEVKGLVEAGKVGFPEVQKVIENLTNSGSMFGGLMEAQSKSLVGLQAQLGDAVDAMFNDMGRSQEGLLTETFKGAIAVVENYEKVIDVLKVVVATYGAYRAAVMLTAAVQSASLILSEAQAFIALARSIKTAADAQALLNIAVRSNPYVIAATALAALVSAFVVFGGEATRAEQAQNGLNEAMKKAEDAAVSEQAKIQVLTTQIRNESLSRDERNRKLQELINLSPRHLGALTLENAATAEGTKLIGDYIEAKKRQLELKEIEAQLETSIANQNKARRGENDLSFWEKLSLSAASSTGDMDYTKASVSERKRLNDQIIKDEDQVQEKLRERIKALSGVDAATTKTAGTAEKSTKKTVQAYDEEIKALKEKQEKESASRADFLKYQQQIDALERKRDAITGGKKTNVAEKDKPQPYGSLAYWDQVAEKAREVLSKTPETDVSKIASQQVILAEAAAKADEIRKAQAIRGFDEELDYKRRQYELYERWVQHTGKESANAQFSELRKSGASFSDYLQAEMDRIANQSLSTGGLSEEDVTKLDKLKAAFNEVTGAEAPIETFRKRLDETRESSGSLTEEIEKLRAIQRELDGDTSASGWEKRQAAAMQLLEAEKERKRLLQEFLASVAGSEQRETAIRKQYADLRAQLDKQHANKKAKAYLDALDKINQAEKEELEEDKLIAAKASKEFKALEKLTEKHYYNLRQMDIKNARDAMNRAKERYGAESKEYEEFRKKYLSITSNYTEKTKAVLSGIAGMASELGSVFSMVGGNAGGFGEFISTMASMIGRLADTLDKMGKDSDGFKFKNISDWVTLIIQLIGAVVNAYKKLQQQEEEYFDNSYQLVLKRRSMENDALGKNHNSNLFVRDYAGEVKAGIAQYADALEDFDNAIRWLDQGRAVVGWRGGLFRNKNNRKIYDDLLKAYPELVDESGKFNRELAETLINTNMVDENTKRMLENAIAASDQLTKAQEQVNEVISELVGQLGNEIADALAQAFRNGEDSAQAFGKAVGRVLEGMLKQLVFSKVFAKDFEKLKDDLAEEEDPMKWVDIITTFTRDSMNKSYTVDQMWKMLQERLKKEGIDIFGSEEGSTNRASGLQGAIKGMSEETASILAGQFNAIRIYQADMANNMRISVGHLAVIAQNTAFNRYLVRLENIESLLSDIKKGPPLRSGGL